MAEVRQRRGFWTRPVQVQDSSRVPFRIQVGDLRSGPLTEVVAVRHHDVPDSKRPGRDRFLCHAGIV